MTDLLNWYTANAIYFEIIERLIFILGIPYLAYRVIKFINNYSFDRKQKEIADNLEMRNRIEKDICDFLDGKRKDSLKHSRLCLTHWKNYPSNFDTGTYREWPIFFNLTTMTKKPTGFTSNSGVYVADYLQISWISLYVSKKYGSDICFLALKNKKFFGYKEITDSTKLRAIVFELPYKHIVNFDFRYSERLEYSPIIYTKYDSEIKKMFARNDSLYYKPASRKLFSKDVYIANRINTKDEYDSLVKLDGLINSYWSPKHLYLLIKCLLKKKIDKS